VVGGGVLHRNRCTLPNLLLLAALAASDTATVLATVALATTAFALASLAIAAAAAAVVLAIAAVVVRVSLRHAG